MAKPDIDLPRLRETQRRDYAELESFRKNQYAHVAEYLGEHYGTNGVENPVNVVSQFVNTVVRQLAGDEPRGMCSTFNRSLRPYSEAMQGDMNTRLKQMRYGDILQRKIFDSLFLIGITRTAICAPAEARFGGYARVPGKPSISNIAFEDWCCDTSVSCIQDGEYQCHCYEAIFDDIKNSKLFPASLRKDLQPTEPRLYNDGGDPKLNTLGATTLGRFDRYEKYIRMCEVWMPRYGVIVTFAVDQKEEEPLLVQEWIGPASGPYDYLSLQVVSGKQLPKAPVMDLITMARSLNLHWKHLDNQASQQKDIVAYRNEGDANKLQNAEQGSYQALADPQSVLPIKMFGVNQELAVWAGTERQVFNELSGTRALGGLSSSSKTATQEKLVAESASELVQAWGARVTKSAKRDMEALGWYYHHNPHETTKSVYQLRGMPDVSAPVLYTPEQRAAIPFEELDIDIDPYSLNYTPPAQRAQILDQMLTQVFIPLAGAFAQPGVGDLLDKYTDKIAKYRNMPEIRELAECLIGAQGDPAIQSSEDQPAESPNRETVHTRVSKPGMTDRGNEQVLQQLMAGGKQKTPGARGEGVGQMGAA